MSRSPLQRTWSTADSQPLTEGQERAVPSSFLFLSKILAGRETSGPPMQRFLFFTLMAAVIGPAVAWQVSVIHLCVLYRFGPRSAPAWLSTCFLPGLHRSCTRDGETQDVPARWRSYHGSGCDDDKTWRRQELPVQRYYASTCRLQRLLAHSTYCGRYCNAYQQVTN